MRILPSLRIVSMEQLSPLRTWATNWGALSPRAKILCLNFSARSLMGADYTKLYVVASILVQSAPYFYRGRVA